MEESEIFVHREQKELVSLERVFHWARVLDKKDRVSEPAWLAERCLEALEIAKHPGSGKLESYTLQVRRTVLIAGWAAAVLGCYGKDVAFSWQNIPVEVPFEDLLIIATLTGIVLVAHFWWCARGDIRAYGGLVDAQREKIRDKYPKSVFEIVQEASGNKGADTGGTAQHWLALMDSSIEQFERYVSDQKLRLKWLEFGLPCFLGLAGAVLGLARWIVL